MLVASCAAMSRRLELIAVFAGGCAGALARVELAQALPHGAGSWPWATQLANIAGAFVLGLVVAGGPQRPTEPGWLAALLGPGFCGALTTFSTLQLELLDLLDDGHAALACGYCVASIGGGLAAVALATRVEDYRGASA
jgi:CrcB protein